MINSELTPLDKESDDYLPIYIQIICLSTYEGGAWGGAEKLLLVFKLLLLLLLLFPATPLR